MKNSIKIIIAAVLLTGLFVACSGKKTENKEQTPQEKLSGQWEIVSAKGELSEMNIGTVYTFGENSAFSTKLGIIESKGKISKIDDKSFSVKFDEYQNEFNYKYSFDADKLIIEIANSNQVFTLEKQ